MIALFAQRLVQAVLILLGVALITFLLLHYLPADPAALAGAIEGALLHLDRSVAEAVLRKEQIRERFSLSVMSDGVEAIYRRAMERRYRAAETSTLASLEASH